MAPSAITVVEQTTPSWTEPCTLPVTGASKDIHNDIQHNGKTVAKQMMGDVLQKRVESIDLEGCGSGEDDAFFVADMGEVYRQHLRWKKNLKRVKPFYAVKCNPDPVVLRLLAELGTGFDCASKWEIDQVLKLGVDPSRIIFANPCKTNSYVRWAQQQGVRQMTFDNGEELYKIKKHFPDAELFLRIMTDDSGSACQLSQKFGAHLNTTHGLLKLARSLDLNVLGVSFHVGSGATDPKAFEDAVRDARFVFDQASEIGFNMKTLDVGGGFIGDTFESMAGQLSQALDHFFPPHVQIIGEPGRYYVARAFTLACNVIARRTVPDPSADQTSYMLYLNDGLYGNFSGVMFDHQVPIPQLLYHKEQFHYGQQTSEYESAAMTTYSLWGPTCDGIDCISARCSFAQVIEVGDWMYFEDMGG
ncbi:MAG: U3 small nucleolar RNA-associated protein [Chaenotheca gracillima]|nr:MAG: U3 small nucleolar RNA-associated protein [Chaenotheca gracillima]